MHFRLPVLTLLVAAVAIGIHSLPDAATIALQFDRHAVAAGQWWRVVTAHLTHFDSNHLAWDVGALIALGAICETRSRRCTAVTLGLASVAISAAVWLFQSQFETYRGLSGLDCALFGTFSMSLIQQRTRASVVLGIAALVGVSAKCIFELTTGTTAFASGNSYAPVPLAHLVGVLSGIAATSITTPLIRKHADRIKVEPNGA